MFSQHDPKKKKLSIVERGKQREGPIRPGNLLCLSNGWKKVITIDHALIISKKSQRVLAGKGGRLKEKNRAEFWPFKHTSIYDEKRF